jgi:hypothetical protein
MQSELLLIQLIGKVCLKQNKLLTLQMHQHQ